MAAWQRRQAKWYWTCHSWWVLNPTWKYFGEASPGQFLFLFERRQMQHCRKSILVFKFFSLASPFSRSVGLRGGFSCWGHCQQEVNIPPNLFFTFVAKILIFDLMWLNLVEDLMIKYLNYRTVQKAIDNCAIPRFPLSPPSPRPLLTVGQNNNSEKSHSWHNWDTPDDNQSMLPRPHGKLSLN